MRNAGTEGGALGKRRRELVNKGRTRERIINNNNGVYGFFLALAASSGKGEEGARIWRAKCKKEKKRPWTVIWR